MMASTLREALPVHFKLILMAAKRISKKQIKAPSIPLITGAV